MKPIILVIKSTNLIVLVAVAESDSDSSSGDSDSSMDEDFIRMKSSSHSCWHQPKG